MLLPILLACRAADQPGFPGFFTTRAADTAAADTAPRIADDTGDAPSCPEPALRAGCTVSGEFSESSAGVLIDRITIPANTLLVCDEPWCAWMVSTRCLLRWADGTTNEYSCEARFYPTGVAGSGIGELGWVSGGTRTCLLGARVEGERTLVLSPRPEGAEADAIEGGYNPASCLAGGGYEVEGGIAAE